MDLVWSAAVQILTETMLVNHASVSIRHKDAVTENQHQSAKIVQNVQQAKTAQIQVYLFAATVLAVNAATILETIVVILCVVSMKQPETPHAVQTEVTLVAMGNVVQQIKNVADLMVHVVRKTLYVAPTQMVNKFVYRRGTAVMEKFVVITKHAAMGNVVRVAATEHAVKVEYVAGACAVSPDQGKFLPGVAKLVESVTVFLMGKYVLATTAAGVTQIPVVSEVVVDNTKH